MGSSHSRVQPNSGLYSEEGLNGVKLEDEDQGEKVEDGVTRVRGHFEWAVGGEGGKRERFGTVVWRPQGEVKALVFLCHGFAEHLSECWEGLGRLLASRGLLAFGHDHLGHGRTSGERVQGAVSFQDDYCVPLAAHCLARAKAEGRHLPLFVVGHSMGGLISLVAASNCPKGLVRGVVVNGPMIEVDPDIASPLTIFVAKCLASWWPSKQLSKVEEDEITSNKEWVKKIMEDELNWHGGIKAKHGLMSLKALQHWESEGESAFDLPLLIQQGSEDKICRPEGARRLLDRVASRDKKMKTYPGKHNPYIESGSVPEEAIGDACDWICARLGPPDQEDQESSKEEGKK